MLGWHRFPQCCTLAASLGAWAEKNGPKLPLVDSAANGGSEPKVPDAARRTNGYKLRKPAVRPKLTIRSWRISAVANVSPNQPLAVLSFKQGVG